MSEDLAARVSAICREYGADAGRMIDITRAVQAELGCVSNEAVGIISALTGATLADVESCVSFYSFLSSEQKGRVVIRVSDDVPDRMAGFQRVLDAFADELGIQPGETDLPPSNETGCRVSNVVGRDSRKGVGDGTEEVHT